jgi:hypothetical protein
LTSIKLVILFIINFLNFEFHFASHWSCTYGSCSLLCPLFYYINGRSCPALLSVVLSPVSCSWTFKSLFGRAARACVWSGQDRWSLAHCAPFEGCCTTYRLFIKLFNAIHTVSLLQALAVFVYEMISDTKLSRSLSTVEVAFQQYKLYISKEIVTESRSQWPCGLRQVLYSAAWTLGSWVRIPLEAWICVRVFLCCVVLCR